MPVPITPAMNHELERAIKFAEAFYNVVTAPYMREYANVEGDGYKILKKKSKSLLYRLRKLKGLNDMKWIEVSMDHLQYDWAELIKLVEERGPLTRDNFAREMLLEGVPVDTPIITYKPETSLPPSDVISPSTTFKIARGQEAMILYTEIEDGDAMVDFHGERDKFHRFYTKYVYDKFIRRRAENPITRQPIKAGDVSQYTAKLVEPTEETPVWPVREEGGRRKRKTRRVRRRRITHRLK
jgi:hypothetical protein